MIKLAVPIISTKMLTALALLSTFRKPFSAHRARLRTSTCFLNTAIFHQLLTGISTCPHSSKYRTLTTRKGLAGSQASIREAIAVRTHPETIIIDQIVDHLLPLDMNDEAQLTFVLGT